ncbi:MAG: phosphoribosylformylglycinamidine synthase I [Phycisphaeraceae bacterium]|nr:phosphoribosylformylglycinamidine synthase I [Phycisphaeraceae bacterium]
MTDLDGKPPRTLIIRAAGTNCDRELAHAFETAGARCAMVHVNRLIERPDLVDEFEMIGVPGGFSYGDDIAAGRIFANRLRHHLLDPLRAAADRGVPIIGICNGFQVLVKLGLLPDPVTAPTQTATLADNRSGRFIDRWVGLDVAPATRCVWTRGLDRVELPIAHGEGRFVADEKVLARLREQGQVALRYARAAAADGIRGGFHGNPNGSADDIAGICDPTGVVLGLMPHPERFVTVTQHPAWPRMDDRQRIATPDGLRMFENAVQHVRERVSGGGCRVPG